MKKYILILTFILSPFISISGDLEFYKEDLNFTIEDDNFISDGVYYFRNLGHTEINQNLLYSFPVSNMGSVDSIYVFDIENNKEIEKRKVERFGNFNINLSPYSSGKIRVYYRQKITTNYCKYVFKSTQSWNRPIESSAFKLKVKKDIKIDSISYNIDSTKIIDKYNVHFWEFKDFYPTKDFELWFHKAKK